MSWPSSSSGSGSGSGAASASASARLGVKPGHNTFKLNVGESFFQSVKYEEDCKRGKRSRPAAAAAAFHTMRYDFKPASIDQDRRGSLVVEADGKGVQVSVPNVNSRGQQPFTHYGGHMKEAGAKDCVLIIDHSTGKITLERLSSHIMVKKKRPEKSEYTLGIPPRPLTPLDPMFKKVSGKSSPASARSSPSHSNLLTIPSTSRNSSRSSSPVPHAPPAQTSSSSMVPHAPHASSMSPSANYLKKALKETAHVAPAQKPAPPTRNTGFGFGDLSSSTSSSSSDSFSDDDDDNILVPKSRQVLPHLGQSSPSMPTDLLMPSAPILAPVSAPASPRTSAPPIAQRTNTVKNSSPTRSSNAAASSLSMPQMLNDDLQLSSESESSEDEFD